MPKFLASLRLKRFQKTARLIFMINKLTKLSRESSYDIQAEQIFYLLDADLLGELKSEDSQLAPLRKCTLAKDREGFFRLGRYLSEFRDDTTVKSD